MLDAESNGHSNTVDLLKLAKLLTIRLHDSSSTTSRPLHHEQPG